MNFGQGEIDAGLAPERGVLGVMGETGIVWAASSLAFHPQAPWRVIKWARAVGLGGVEFLCEPPWHPGGWSGEHIRAVRAEGFPLSLHAPVADVNLMSPHPGVRILAERELGAVLSLAARLGAGPVTFHLGYRPPMGAPHEPPWHEAKAAIARLAKEAQALGVALCLENDPKLPGTYLWDLERFRAFLGELNILGTLDLGHAWTAHGAEALPYLVDLGPHLRVVHLHDNRGELDEHLALGEGTIDLAGALPLLRVPTMVIEAKTPEAIRHSLTVLSCLRDGPKFRDP